MYVPKHTHAHTYIYLKIGIYVYGRRVGINSCVPASINVHCRLCESARVRMYLYPRDKNSISSNARSATARIPLRRGGGGTSCERNVVP